MSRSRKKAFYRDKPDTRRYWRTIRRVQKMIVSSFMSNTEQDIIIPSEKEIINDYDYSDYKSELEYTNLKEYKYIDQGDVDKMRRK